jgi:hypothetical protein
MKTGKTLQELAIEIERQYASKKDYIAPTRLLDIVPRGDEVKLQVHEKGEYGIGEIAHTQIAEHVGIPAQYYSKMREKAPELLANNVQHWFNKYPADRLVRTLDGKARAFLSDKYQPMDNYDFASAVLPILRERNLQVMSCEITEKKLYIKAVDQQLFRDVPVGFRMGDGSHKIFTTCAPAIILSNSEVGFGKLVCDSGVYEGGCTNLALFSKGGFKRTHVGVRHQLLEESTVGDLDEILSRGTKRRTMEALWMQVHDVVMAAFDEKVVAKRAEAIEVAAGRQITGDVVKVMELVQEQFKLVEDERSSIFKHLIEGGNLSQYGLHAAITRAAQDVSSYDRASELEYLGGSIVELPAVKWEALAEAA